jgi:predicted nucleic acid-binding protein
MSRSILADTGPLFAAVDPDDAQHPRAQSELKRAAREKLELVISYSTVLETHSLILRRLGTEPAEDWLTDILASARFVNPTAEDYIVAATKVATFTDQSITLFDAVLAVLAARLRFQVWTYDHHFDVMRTNVWRR